MLFFTCLQYQYRRQKKDLLPKFWRYITGPLTLESFAVTHRPFLIARNTRSCSFACLQHHETRNCPRRKRTCVARGWDSPLTSSCTSEQKQHDFTCLCLKVGAQSGRGKGKSSSFCVKNDKRLCDAPQQRLQLLVANVTDQRETSI